MDKTDIVLVIDTSTRLNMQLYNIQLNAAKNTLSLLQKMNSVEFGSEHIQVGAVSFSGQASPVLWLNETYDMELLAGRIESVQQDKVNSSSNLSKALEYIRNVFLTVKHGARSESRKFIVHFNCGVDSDVNASHLLVKQLKNDNNIMVTIGVGESFDDNTVISLSSSPFYAFFADQDLPEDDIQIMLKTTRYLTCTTRVRT